MRFLSPADCVAIRKLQGDSQVIRDFLDGLPQCLNDLAIDDEDQEKDPIDRARSLAVTLKSFLLSMAEEIEELPGESGRLQSEAVGLILALREVFRHYPELAPDE